MYRLLLLNSPCVSLVRIYALTAQIAQKDRPVVGPISGNVGRDIGLMSEIISGRYRCMSADIGPTPCLHVGSMSARCRPTISGRHLADIDSMSADV